MQISKTGTLLPFDVKNSYQFNAKVFLNLKKYLAKDYLSDYFEINGTVIEGEQIGRELGEYGFEEFLEIKSLQL